MQPRGAEYRLSDQVDSPRYSPNEMKTLIIAEKPSVGRDIAGALDGVFQSGRSPI